MGNRVCIQCLKVYGTVAANGDSHGLCGETCKAAYTTWMRDEPGAVAPALADPVRVVRAVTARVK